MQCKSDKYDVIAETMGPMLNEGLCSMLKDDRKIRAISQFTGLAIPISLLLEMLNPHKILG